MPTGGDDFVWLAVAGNQLAQLDRMGGERRVVDLAVLIRVASGGKLERSVRDWQAYDPVVARRGRTVGLPGA